MSVRDEFLLDPTVVFLNHGSFGATPRPVFEEYQRWQREMERQPVEFLGRRSDDLLDEARRALADYLHAEADDLVFAPNATTGVNIVARSLGLRPGDEVLGTDLEYGACDRTWEEVCGAAGATYVRQPVPLPVASPEQIAEAVWAGVSPRTRVLYLSHVTSGTALTLPVARLCRRAREAGIFTVVDGAHVPGHLPLDLAAVGADAYAGNLHKWLGAPKGSGFLHVRREHHGWMGSSIVSWGWVKGSEHRRAGVSEYVNRNQWQGTRDVAAFLAVPAAIRYQAQRDWPAIRTRCQALASEARRRVQGLTGVPPLSPEPTADGYPWFVQMVACPLPPLDGKELKRRLYDEYRVETPVTYWRDRCFLRLSFQGYNTEDDLDAAVAALASLLPRLAVG